MTAAVFWDRDGTLIHDPGYLSDPEKLELLPGAPEALRRATEAGFLNIVVSNQSGVARGRMTEQTVEAVNARLCDRLAAAGARLDAVYYCPYLDGDEAVVAAYRQESDLRKPKPGMLLKAADEHGIDLEASWCVGDSPRDAGAGRAAGCRTILLVEDGSGKSKRPRGSVDFTAGSLTEAIDIVLRHTTRTATEMSANANETQVVDVADPVAPVTQEPAEPGAVTVAAEAGAPDGTLSPSAPPAATPTTEATPPPSSSTVESTLQEILGFLRMVDRRTQAEEFSLARLAGAMVQLLAIAAMIWAVFGLIWNDASGVQAVRLLFALTFQTFALTLFVLSGKK